MGEQQTDALDLKRREPRHSTTPAGSMTERPARVSASQRDGVDRPRPSVSASAERSVTPSFVQAW